MSVRSIVISQDSSKYISIEQQLYNTLSLIENGFKHGDLLKLTLKFQKPTRKRKIYSTTSTTATANGNDLELKSMTTNSFKTSVINLEFPSIHSNINHKFTMYHRVLKMMHKLVSTKDEISKRQLYYSDVELFKQQQGVVDDIVDNISRAMNVSIEKLGIIASPKGLIYGELKFRYKGNKIFEFVEGCVNLIPAISLDSTKDDFEMLSNPPDEILRHEKGTGMITRYSTNTNNKINATA
ncbi:unnamed protein product [Ambrosiozyma monospora]|uniref:Unnamed protein product n=1 Tax=Ambrosiozyma monospora TaxID=43982 RepID=A0ACB5TH57_AMBMO|nr:unnamed protein product [Ambrosiozyma monospora]